MIITDALMRKRMDKALKLGGNLFTLDDIEFGLQTGAMQGHVENNTWAITRVHQWPRRKSVDVLFVVGNMDGALLLEDTVERWAKEQGADLMTATGRDGWWGFRTPNWEKVGTLYSKDI